VKIAPDGEILVRGENVTQGYFNAADETARAFEDGWFHTGDVGELAADGQLYIRGRKKEMIVTPEGLNVFPEDVERVARSAFPAFVNRRGRRPIGSEERVHAVLVLEPGRLGCCRPRCQRELDDHQKIRRALCGPNRAAAHRRHRKLKRAAIREWAASGSQSALPRRQASDALAALIAKHAGRGDLPRSTTIEELGLSSLDRVELMVALEDAFQTRIDESASPARATSVSCASWCSAPRRATPRRRAGSIFRVDAVVVARAIRRVNLPTWILPLARLFAWLPHRRARQLRDVQRAGDLRANHQSFMDGR
jgi:long-chain acyl-CoA synthetase